jgi:hypothetical protein
MLMPSVFMLAMVAVPAVSAAFGLERGLHLYKIRFEVMEHILDHMVGADAKNLVSNLSPNKLSSGLNLQQPPIVKLQAISIGHRNCFRKVEKDIFALIGSQANAAAMARVKIEGESACCLVLRPMPGWAMN